MPRLTFEGRTVLSRESETVLDAFLRHGVSVPFSCRNGTCHVCMQRCDTPVPPVAQNGLRPELKEQGYFLACRCVPLADMDISAPAALYATTLVASSEMLSPNVCRLLLEPPPSFTYRAGQFLNIRRHDGQVRSYSLASLPGKDYFLELHVQRKEGGDMSNWILDDLKPGDELDIQGADGECYYREEVAGNPMLLIGSGTGVAPLYGILRDALDHAHAGEIHLYHGGRSTERFYLRGELRELEAKHRNFHYYECLSGEAQPPDGALAGRATDIAFTRHKDLHGWHVFLAGSAEMVDDGERLAVEHGAAPAAIHTDAFVFRDLRKTPRTDKNAAAPSAAARAASSGTPESELGYPPPDPELWKALREGELLSEILKDFYGIVFADDRLASFFEGVTNQRLIEKQYLFLRQIMTGEKIYFGDRPRNAHHWMVISDGLFDYRESIMESCLRKHGLPEDMVHRFMEIEGYYRPDIVKAAPFARRMGDIEIPFEGFDELVMDVGTLCDSCGREVAVGEKVIYHVRLGKIYCSECSTTHTHDVPQA